MTDSDSILLLAIDEALLKTGCVLLAMDFDGTLCPITNTPSDVCIPPETLDVLRIAAQSPRLTVAVISGRTPPDLRRHLPLDLIFAGNHGLEITGRGLNFVHGGALLVRPSLLRAHELLRPVAVRWPGAWIEDKGLSATLHYRRVEQRFHNSLVLAAKRAVRNLDAHLRLRMGKLALEVHPRVPWDKGSALQYIQALTGPFSVCICIADEDADESMFRANRGGLNIRVGTCTATAATHCISNPSDVAVVLSHLADNCSSESALAWAASRSCTETPNLRGFDNYQR